MHDPVRMLLLQFLDWVACAPRSYGDVMDAWRTSCPRLPVWEEAVERGLVRTRHRADLPMADCAVELTEAGKAARRAASVTPERAGA